MYLDTADQDQWSEEDPDATSHDFIPTPIAAEDEHFLVPAQPNETAVERCSTLQAQLQGIGLDAGFIALLKRREVWAIGVAQYCQSWGLYVLLNWLPTFFSEQVCIVGWR